MLNALTSPALSDKPRTMGRNHFVGEQTLIRFKAGTLDRIAAVLVAGEKKADFIRQAVERELVKRERAAKK